MTTKVILSHEVLDFNITLTANGTDQFNEIRGVVDSSDFGVQLRNVEIESKFGVNFTTTPGSETTAMHVGVMIGLFKWPSTAATPTTSTIDVETSGKIINRRIGTAIGTFPGVIRNRLRRLNLKPGEELWYVVRFVRQSGTTADLSGISMIKLEHTRL